MLSSVAARTKIDPKIGPMQGVQPKAKAIPISIGLKKFVFELVLNSKTPLVFIAHAARDLEDLTGSIEEFKNKKTDK